MKSSLLAGVALVYIDNGMVFMLEGDGIKGRKTH